MTCEETVREIRLACGSVCLVDADVYEWVSRHKWQAKKSRGTRRIYAQRASWKDGKKVTYAMHRLIANAGPNEVVDHINGNSLDNRRANLRVTDNRGNATNITRSKLQKRGGFKGVSWNARANKWEASIGAGPIKANGKRRKLYLGLYTRPEEAARAYDAAALKHFGEFAALNYPARTTYHPQARSLLACAAAAMAVANG